MLLDRHYYSVDMSLLELEPILQRLASKVCRYRHHLITTNVILSVSLLPVSTPTLLVFPLRMRQSDRFISSTSPLTSFTVPGTGALIRYRYVTPNPSPFSVRMRQSDPFTSSTPPPPYLFYRTWHRGTDVSLSRNRYVTPSLPTLFSVLLRKPVRAKRPVCI